MPMNILLKAEHVNWGLHGQYDWQHTDYFLSQDGQLNIAIYYDLPGENGTVQISKADLSKIKALMGKIAAGDTNTHGDGCDGTAWQFTFYDELGNNVFETELGYIYGINTLSRLSKILRSYNSYMELEYQRRIIEDPDDKEYIIPDFLKKYMSSAE